MAEKETLVENDEQENVADERVEVELTPEEAKQYETSETPQDDRVAKADDDDESDREAIRERRRQEKKERKERREKAIERDKLELEFLRKRNDDLERRVSGIEENAHKSNVSILDQKLKEAVNEVQLAEKVIAKAVAAQNGEDVAQALRYRDQAMQKARQIEAAKTQAERTVAQPKPKALDDMSLRYAKDFIDEHPWYKPNGTDESSSIVLAIDNGLAREGFDPRSEDYWNELRTRVRRRLPERFADDSDTDTSAPIRPARGSPPVGSGREHAPTSTRREVYISPERKAALIEAGVWDDPVLRQKYIKKYMEYDRQRS